MGKIKTMQIPVRDNGYFDVTENCDPDYPGVDIEFIPKGEDSYAIGHARVCLEWPEDSKAPVVYVWSQPDSEDWSYRIPLTNAVEDNNGKNDDNEGLQMWSY